MFLSMQAINKILKYIDDAAGDEILGVVLNNKKAELKDVFTQVPTVRTFYDKLTGFEMCVDNLDSETSHEIRKLFGDYLSILKESLDILEIYADFREYEKLIKLVESITALKQLDNSVNNSVIVLLFKHIKSNQELAKEYLDTFDDATLKTIQTIQSFLHIPEVLEREEELKEKIKSYGRLRSMLLGLIDNEINKLTIEKAEEKEKLKAIEEVKHLKEAANKILPIEEKKTLTNRIESLKDLVVEKQDSSSTSSDDESSSESDEDFEKNSKKEVKNYDKTDSDNNNEIKKLRCFISYARYTSRVDQKKVGKFVTKLKTELESTQKIHIISREHTYGHHLDTLKHNLEIMKSADYIIHIVLEYTPYAPAPDFYEELGVKQLAEKIKIITVLYEKPFLYPTFPLPEYLQTTVLSCNKELIPSLLTTMGISKLTKEKVMPKKEKNVSEKKPIEQKIRNEEGIFSKIQHFFHMKKEISNEVNTGFNPPPKNKVKIYKKPNCDTDYSKLLQEKTIEFVIQPDANVDKQDRFFSFRINFIHALPRNEILVGDEYGILRILTCDQDEQWICTQTIKNSKYAVRCAAILKTEKIVTGSLDGELIFLERNKENQWVSIQSLKEHEKAIHAVCELQDGKLMSASMDIICVWDRNSEGQWFCEQKLNKDSGNVNSLALLSDGTVVGGGYDGIFFLECSSKGKWSFGYKDKLGREIFSVIALSETQIACGSGNGWLYILECNDVNGQRYWNSNQSMGAHSSVVYSLGLLPDGKFASGSYDKTFYIWDCNDQGKWSSVYKLQEDVRCLSTLPNGKVAAVCGENKICIWSFDKLELENTIQMQR